MSKFDVRNSTSLSDARLATLFRECIGGWAVGTLAVRVRYSRGADFSGTCFYTDRRIHVNLGKHLAYPYVMQTHLARARTVGRRWYKPSCTIELRNGYELVIFIFMHELYHLLVKRAKRNTRQKESMCDRFAASYLVDRFGVAVRGRDGMPIPREEWDFQDLHGFVAAACDRRTRLGSTLTRAGGSRNTGERQLLLFPA